MKPPGFLSPCLKWLGFGGLGVWGFGGSGVRGFGGLGVWGFGGLGVWGFGGSGVWGLEALGLVFLFLVVADLSFLENWSGSGLRWVQGLGFPLFFCKGREGGAAPAEPLHCEVLPTKQRNSPQDLP